MGTTLRMNYEDGADDQLTRKALQTSNNIYVRDDNHDHNGVRDEVPCGVIAETLASTAVELGSTDDVTVVVMKLGKAESS